MRTQPELITLGVRPGVAPSGRPPVRIFLGTEASQFRPERVLVWSVERVRDPSRVYEIHLMKELAGFDRRGWTTGFTNYRFAIPHFVGGRGRAIYNDEDQIYLSDPAALFDREMGQHGFLAIAPRESSVMLIDCERMAGVWSLEEAQRASKKTILDRSLASEGLWGPLEVEWNARDGEYREGRSHLIHYTTLHTQPWRPFPGRFVYMQHPLAGLWHDLERSADAAGFQLFGRQRPSAAFRALAARATAVSGSGSAAWAEPRLAELRERCPGSLLRYAPLGGPPAEGCDLVALGAGLEAVPEDDVPWLLDEAFAAARRLVFAAIDPGPAPGAARQPSASPDPERWAAHFEAASRRRPDVHWELWVRGPGGERCARGGRFLGEGPPQVWVLEDPSDGAPDAALAVAAKLGWPVRRLRPEQAVAPWPDLVLSAGRRAGAAARRIRSEANGSTRVVVLGAEQGARAEDFDLVVTPAAAGFLEHPRRLETALPLVAVDRVGRDAAAARWREAFASRTRPRLALLVGGVAGVSVGALRRLAERLLVHVRELEGSLFAVVDPRFPADALAAASRVERRRLDARCEPALACAELADEIHFAGDADDLLAEVCASGRPLVLHPLRVRRGPVEASRALVEAIACRGRSNDRGTLRPQQGLERLCSRLIERGRVRPPRHRERLQGRLLRAGAARLWGGPAPAEFRALGELEGVADRVRELLGVPGAGV